MICVRCFSNCSLPSSSSSSSVPTVFAETKFSQHRSSVTRTRLGPHPSHSFRFRLSRSLATDEHRHTHTQTRAHEYKSLTSNINQMKYVQRAVHSSGAAHASRTPSWMSCAVCELEIEWQTDNTRIRSKSIDRRLGESERWCRIDFIWTAWNAKMQKVNSEVAAHAKWNERKIKWHERICHLREWFDYIVVATQTDYVLLITQIRNESVEMTRSADSPAHASRFVASALTRVPYAIGDWAARAGPSI